MQSLQRAHLGRRPLPPRLCRAPATACVALSGEQEAAPVPHCLPWIELKDPLLNRHPGERQLLPEDLQGFPEGIGVRIVPS